MWLIPFVMSITVGAVEKVPYAKNCAVPSKLPIETKFGKTVIDSRGSGAAEAVTVMVAVVDTTLPSGFVSLAVIVVVPALTPATCPAGAEG